ncbi:MAG: zf-HC2 domain-containing protein, partial [Verrucomicrobiota bacterium]
MCPAPDDKTVSDWIDGKLSDEEAAEMEQHFEEILEDAQDDGIDESILRQLSETPPDSELNEVITRVKSGLACDAFAPSEDAWREIVS